MLKENAVNDWNLNVFICLDQTNQNKSKNTEKFETNQSNNLILNS